MTVLGKRPCSWCGQGTMELCPREDHATQMLHQGLHRDYRHHSGHDAASPHWICRACHSYTRDFWTPFIRPFEWKD